MVEFLSKFRKFYRSAIFQREDASPSAVASCRGSLAEGIISSRVHSLSILQLYPEALSPDSYRRKNISWSRSAGRQMLALLCPCYPYSLESKIFTEAFSTPPAGGMKREAEEYPLIRGKGGGSDSSRSFWNLRATDFVARLRVEGPWSVGDLQAVSRLGERKTPPFHDRVVRKPLRLDRRFIPILSRRWSLDRRTRI